MKTITCPFIREFNPCYDPTRHLPETYSGSVVDFLCQEQIPAHDRIWVAKYFVTDKTNRLFAVWCARQALALQKEVDPRSTAACDVAERFANGEATQAELDSAYSAARSAARSAAYSAARSAAYSAADSAARSAADSAAYSAARSAAYSAARSAARSAAYSAAYSAARSAAYSAAYSAARSAAYSAQINYLIKVLERDEP